MVLGSVSFYLLSKLATGFRPGSSNQWKKYVEGVGRVPELSRHKTELDVGRKQRQQQPHNGVQRKPEKKRPSG